MNFYLFATVAKMNSFFYRREGRPQFTLFKIWKQYIVFKFMKKVQYMYCFIKATRMSQSIEEYFR